MRATWFSVTEIARAIKQLVIGSSIKHDPAEAASRV